MMNYLAFDLGASSGKLYLGNFDGNRLALRTVHRFANMPIPLSAGLYWDFLQIWHNMNLGIQKAWHTQSPIVSFGVDSFSNDFSFIDRTGDLLSPVRCYRDARTSRCSEAIYKRLPPRQLYEATGNQVAPFNTLMQLAAMREEQKDQLLDSAYKLLLLPDLLAYYLTGETLAEYTVSSVSQVFDFSAGSWSEKILGAYNIPLSLFGRLVAPGTVSGHAQKGYQQANGVGGFDFVSVCEHDTASAFLASTCQEECAIISSGTWALVGTEVPAPIINSFGFENNIANEGGYAGHHRLIRNVMGSWLLQELLADYQLQGQQYSYNDLSVMAEQEHAFAYLIDVDDPLFFQPGGMRANIQQKCREQYGHVPETPGQLARCVCESLALKYRWAIEKLEQLSGRSLPVVSIVGGGSKDELTCRFTANACARPVLAGPADASALGNILVQMLARGEIASISQGRQLIRDSFPVTEYPPCDIPLWEEVYQSFKQRYKLS